MEMKWKQITGTAGCVKHVISVWALFIFCTKKISVVVNIASAQHIFRLFLLLHILWMVEHTWSGSWSSGDTVGVLHLEVLDNKT